MVGPAKSARLTNAARSVVLRRATRTSERAADIVRTLVMMIQELIVFQICQAIMAFVSILPGPDRLPNLIKQLYDQMPAYLFPGTDYNGDIVCFF